MLHPTPSIEAQIAKLTSEIAHLSTIVASHKAAQNELTNQVTALNNTWNAASGMLRLIKWLAVISAAAGTFVTALKTHLPHIG